MLSDLRPLSSINCYNKYADDAGLLSPENTDVDIVLEFDNLKSWSVRNKLPINFSKTKEIVFHRPSPRLLVLPSPITNIERVFLTKLLGVTITDDFRFNSHINSIITVCNQRLYLLKSLKSSNLSTSSLHIIFNTLIISSILHALPAWGGFVTAHDITPLDSILSKSYKFGYSTKRYCFTTLLNESDGSFFKNICSQNHCINHLLPQLKPLAYNSRPRGHSYALPQINFTLFKKSFINRALLNFV